ncbi:MAG TPA: HAMP domain-containing sensor histidine kinase [Verrucomicrobiae bacterium]|nr:HAMP domain-containing sensor histidine kinase [Verrucomicrobiae bacterium]
MKIFKSIKWRLQIWYGLILVLVLAALGSTAYKLESNLLFNRIDDELQRRFGVLADALHPHPPGLGSGPRPFDRPPPGEMPDDFPPPGPAREEFYLPPQADALFDPNEPHRFYYFILNRDGKEIARSTNSGVPIASVPARQAAHEMFSWGRERFLGHLLPSGETVWVGCQIVPELNELKRTGFWLSGAGGIILLFGLAGGWWITSRAIRPVENISATAVKIAAGDLSQRINAHETESELGRLAVILNSTFARLESAFEQQKQFASDAAHELRTPISVILTQTQTALGREREAKDYKQTIEACQRAAQRMRKLIGALLELARLDAGQEPMTRLPLDLSKLVSECVELVHPLADGRGIKINVDVAPLEIAGDVERLGLVVTNLLMNAIEYNHEGGEVRIGAHRDGNMAILTVKDTGRGISAEDLPRVFERFYRADKSRASGHAGLGLAISKAIVSAHGGTIDAVSEENAGAVFTVRLPA